MQERALLLVVALFAARSVAAEIGASSLASVESGLRPAIVVGEPGDERFRLVERMAFYKTPGVGVAVINHGLVAWARGFGVREEGGADRVNAETLFQAASISKPVTAMVALRLVEQGKLDLDEDVNLKLRSWKLPDNEFTSKNKVTLRLLLSHRGGLNDNAGFKGVDDDRPLPTLREILESGKWTPGPIRVGARPGERFQYSGGGYCLVQQLLEDVSRKPFSELARELVLDPLGMTHSTFDHEMPSNNAAAAAVGHGMNGHRLPQKWNRYAASGAAGLWTTPSDLARFAIELQKWKSAGAKPLVSRQMLAEMLSVQGASSDRDSKVIAMREGFAERPAPAWGLGIGLIGKPPIRFFHTGSNPGYQCELQAYLEGGQGAVVMTNGAQGWRLGREILCAIAEEFKWPDYDYRPETKKVARLSREQLERFVGRYRIARSGVRPRILTIAWDHDQLVADVSEEGRPLRLCPEAAERCFTVEDATTLLFVQGKSGRLDTVTSDAGWRAEREDR
jgi:CubicO group peptidase (beta-lactamase class C family)